MTHDDEELLDQIATHLRMQSVPDMPAFAPQHRTAQSIRWRWYLLAAGSLAAAIIGIVLWRASAPTAARRLPEIAQPPIAAPPVATVVLDLDLTEPLNELDAELDALTAELAALRSQAELLDARRRGAELTLSLSLHDGPNGPTTNN